MTDTKIREGKHYAKQKNSTTDAPEKNCFKEDDEMGTFTLQFAVKTANGAVTEIGKAACISSDIRNTVDADKDMGISMQNKKNSLEKAA